MLDLPSASAKVWLASKQLFASSARLASSRSLSLEHKSARAVRAVRPRQYPLSSVVSIHYNHDAIMISSLVRHVRPFALSCPPCPVRSPIPVPYWCGHAPIPAVPIQPFRVCCVQVQRQMRMSMSMSIRLFKARVRIACQCVGIMKCKTPFSSSRPSLDSS